MKSILILVSFYVFQNIGGAIYSQNIKKDYSINSILFIMNQNSILKSVGDLYKYRVKDFDDGEVVYMLSEDGLENLKLIVLPGSGRNVFGEFEVSNKKIKSKLYFKSNFSTFFTESGVRLGMTDSALVSIKGSAQKKIIQADGSILYEYFTSGDPLYYFRAWIKNGKVRRFRFGNVNP